MRRIPMLFATLALVVNGGLAAEVFCIAFDPFCDGFELETFDESGETILFGTWQNSDCAGTDVEVMGHFKGRWATAVCTGVSECPPRGAAENWAFWFDLTANTFDLIGWNPPELPFLQADDIPFSVTMGPCPFLSESSGQPASHW